MSEETELKCPVCSGLMFTAAVIHVNGVLWVREYHCLDCRYVHYESDYESDEND